LEKAPFPAHDFQAISVGLIAPNVRPCPSYPLLMRTCGNFSSVIWFRYVCEKPSVPGSKSAVSVLLSGNVVQPKRNAITELSLSTQVLFSATICGRRFRT
jgi:hypothetical protein